MSTSFYCDPRSLEPLLRDAAETCWAFRWHLMLSSLLAVVLLVYGTLSPGDPPDDADASEFRSAFEGGEDDAHELLQQIVSNKKTRGDHRRRSSPRCRCLLAYFDYWFILGAIVVLLVLFCRSSGLQLLPVLRSAARREFSFVEGLFSDV